MDDALDAKRYRWLRESRQKNWREIGAAGREAWMEMQGIDPAPDRLDAAIDAAIKAEEAAQAALRG